MESVSYVNGAAKRDTPVAPVAPDLLREEMPASRSDTVKLPTWLVGTLIGMAVTLFGQFGATLYQAGQWQANQQNMNAQIEELKREIVQQRDEISALRVELASSPKSK